MLITLNESFNLLSSDEISVVDNAIYGTDDINIYTDGSANSTDTNKNSGFGLVILKDKKELLRIVGSFEKSTNNRMELFALILAVQIINIFPGKTINIHSDSTYALGVFNKGWGQVNRDLIDLAKSLHWNVSITRLNKVKAHSKSDDIHSFGNNIADKLSNDARLELTNSIITTTKKSKQTFSILEVKDLLKKQKESIIDTLDLCPDEIEAIIDL